MSAFLPYSHEGRRGSGPGASRRPEAHRKPSAFAVAAMVDVGTGRAERPRGVARDPAPGRPFNGGFPNDFKQGASAFAMAASQIERCAVPAAGDFRVDVSLWREATCDYVREKGGLRLAAGRLRFGRESVIVSLGESIRAFLGAKSPFITSRRNHSRPHSRPRPSSPPRPSSRSRLRARPRRAREFRGSRGFGGGGVAPCSVSAYHPRNSE